VYSEEAFKKLIEERDKAKEKLRKIEEDAKKKADAEALENGKAKKSTPDSKRSYSKQRNDSRNWKRQSRNGARHYCPGYRMKIG